MASHATKVNATCARALNAASDRWDRKPSRHKRNHKVAFRAHSNSNPKCSSTLTQPHPCVRSWVSLSPLTIDACARLIITRKIVDAVPRPARVPSSHGRSLIQSLPTLPLGLEARAAVAMSTPTRSMPAGRSPFHSPGDRLAYRSYLASLRDGSQPEPVDVDFLTSSDREAVLFGEVAFKCSTARLRRLLNESTDASVTCYLQRRLAALVDLWDNRRCLDEHGRHVAEFYHRREVQLLQQHQAPAPSSPEPGLPLNKTGTGGHVSHIADGEDHGLTTPTAAVEERCEDPSCMPSVTPSLAVLDIDDPSLPSEVREIILRSTWVYGLD